METRSKCDGIVIGYRADIQLSDVFAENVLGVCFDLFTEINILQYGIIIKDINACTFPTPSLNLLSRHKTSV